CPRWQLVDEGGNQCRGPEGGTKCSVACPGSMFAVGGAMGSMARALMGFIPSGIQRRLKQAVRDGRLRDGSADAGKFVRRAGYLREMLSLADAMVAPSNYVRDIFIENGFDAAKIHVIPHGIALPECMPVTHSDKVRFGYIGSFAPLKGVGMLVDAFSNLGTGAELHIHGHGGENHDLIVGRLMERAAGKAVFFHGRYERESLGGLLAGLDAVVVPSMWPETFGIVVREALSCGVPVIVSDCGALPEAVRDGIDGMVFANGDADILSQKMRAFMECPELIKIYSLSIHQVKSIKEHAREIVAIYEDLTK
ncbi:MAG TPA: glycosyltransferase, partial [Nitrospirota bacterium]